MIKDILTFLIVPFIEWLPRIFPMVVALLALIRFLLKERMQENRYISWISYKGLIWGMVWFYLVYAGLWSVGVYLNWFYILQQSTDAVSQSVYKELLNWHYFGLNIWLRYWLHAVIAIISSLIFYAFLQLLGHRNDRFFAEGEKELGLLCSLLAGWPGFVIFIPLVFLSVVVVSIFRMIFFKETYTRLGIPFIFAMLLTLVFGEAIIRILGLTVLKI